MPIATAYLIGIGAVGCVLVAIGVQRLVAWYVSRYEGPSEDEESALEEGSGEKPMTYAEAMASLAKLGPSEGEPTRRRRTKRKAKPEVVPLSALRYGQYSTTDAKLTIHAWRPDSTHRLAGHIVVDIIPKSPAEAMSTTSVRRLAIDLETVEATRVVALADGEAIVLAVSDYEIKGQGVIFKDLDFSEGVGVDENTLYIVLALRDDPALSPARGDVRKADFRRLARGLATAAQPPQQPETAPLVAADLPPADPAVQLRDTSVDHLFHHAFRTVF
mmetsp:Transcript_22976/g.72050  ORF Transcript_22976/g.72050 Transcript_22976/m.72050 type:complete len:274 (+) Transcript_22976:58-879(+)